MSRFNEELDILLSESARSEAPTIARITEDMYELQQLERNKVFLENRISNAISGLYGEMAMAIKRADSGINIAINESEFKVGTSYRTILIRPDFDNRIWVVESKRDTSNIPMTSDMNGTASIIIDQLRGSGEDTTGTGKLFLEGKAATLIDLVKWQERHKVSKLNSRFTRSNVARKTQ